MVKTRRLAAAATACGFLVVVSLSSGSAVAGLCVGQPCIGQPYDGQWMCMPNVEGFGYFPTQWRKWSGDSAPSQLVPGRGAVEIEAPEGLSPEEALKAFREAVQTGEDRQAGPALQGVPPRAAPYVSPGTAAPPPTQPPFSPGGFPLDQGLPSSPLLPPEPFGDDSLLRGGIPGIPEVEPGSGAPAPLLPPEREIYPGPSPGPAEPSPVVPPIAPPPIGAPQRDGASAQGGDRGPFPITRAEVQALLGISKEPRSQDESAEEASTENRASTGPLSDTPSVDEPLVANWMAALDPGARGEVTRTLAQSLSDPIRPVAHEVEVEPQGSSPVTDFPAEVPFARVERADRADSPPVALDGFCPVELTEREQWTAGDPRWTAIHEHRTYLFAGRQQREQFLADPARYSPACAGHDPVLLVDAARRVSGETDYCVTYHGRLYLFASLVTLKRFQRDPQRYLGAGQP